MIQQAYITGWRSIAPWSDDAQVEQNLQDKQTDLAFMGDIVPLLSVATTYDPAAALRLVHNALISKLPGEPWRGTPRKGA